MKIREINVKNGVYFGNWTCIPANFINMQDKVKTRSVKIFRLWTFCIDYGYFVLIMDILIDYGYFD